MTEDANTAIARAVATAFEREVAFLSRLVQVPSDNPPGDCAALAEAAASALADMGFTVERHPVPEARVRAHGMIAVTNLIVRRRFGPGGRTIALNAHGDVVPPGAGWTVDPYGGEVRGGAVWGRGAAVSKSDFATYAFALAALDAAPPSRGAVELHLTFDEEAGGSVGPAWILGEGLSAPDLALSAGFAHGVVNAHNGCLHLEVTVHGRIAHAARPESGRDALEAATAILNALYAHRRGLAAEVSAVPGIGSPKLVVGTIAGGINTNVVPDTVRLRLDRRLIPEENADAVEAGLRTLITDAVAGADGISVEIARLMRAHPLTPLAGSAALAETVAAHARRVLGEEVPVHGVPLYTDARHYAAAGVPVVLYGAGPHTIEEAGAHGADEHVRLDDLAAATEVVACAVRELAQGEAGA